MIFNQAIPEGIGIIERNTPEDMLKNEVEYAVDKKNMKKIIKACYVNLGSTKTAICFVGAVLVSGLFMSFVYKLQEGEGASTGIYGLIAFISAITSYILF